MKRASILLLLMGLFGLALVLTRAQDATPEATSETSATPALSVVIADNIYVRSGPGQDFIPVGRLDSGNLIFPLNRNEDATWVMIRYNAGFGWIRRDLARWVQNIDLLPVADLSNLTPTPELNTEEPVRPISGAIPTPNGNWVDVGERGAFVRAGPDYSYHELGVLRTGDLVEPVGRDFNTGWILIRYNEGFAWILRTLVRWQDDLASLPVLSIDNLTPSPTFTDTAIPTATFTATLTFTPSDTPTDTPTFTPSPTSTYTPSSTYTNTFTPTFTPTETPSDTPTLTPSETPTFTPSFTWTPSPTNTETPSETPTDVPTLTPSNTPTPVPSDTPQPTNTDLPTNTPLPSATFTDVPTNTPVPTDTPLPSATFTPVPTDTPLPSATFTDVPTNTPVPSATFTNVPMDTPVPSATFTDVPTNTPLPSATFTTVPTDTPTFTLIPSATDTLVPTSTDTTEPTQVAAALAVTDTPLPSSTFTDVPTDTPTPEPSATSLETAVVSETPTIAPIASETSALASSATPTTLSAQAVIPTEETTPAAEIASIPTPLPGTPTGVGASAPRFPLEALVGGIGLLLVLSYVGFFWRGLSAQERYRDGFIVSRCPVCREGTLVLDEKQERFLGIPRVKRTVRCTHCRSVLRETGLRRWRYAIDPLANPGMYQRYNGRELEEDLLKALPNQPPIRSSEPPEPHSPVTPPSFIDDDPEG